MKVKLFFLGLGYKNYNQANVKIYDCNNLIYEGLTYNNILELCLEKDKIYTLKAISNNRIIYTNFYTNRDSYIFNFNNLDNSITFILKDDYGYPIERGELILWQKL